MICEKVMKTNHNQILLILDGNNCTKYAITKLAFKKNQLQKNSISQQPEAKKKKKKLQNLKIFGKILYL